MEPYVSAFAPGQSYRSTPYARIPLSEARQMVAEGFAKTVNRGRSIEFFALSMIKLRDRSCSWSHRLMELVGEGNYTACQMLAWLKPHIVAAPYCDTGNIPYYAHTTEYVEDDFVPVDEYIAQAASAA